MCVKCNDTSCNGSHCNSLPKGLRGPRGYQGEKGDKGDKGDAGLMGPQGPPGAQGIAGISGVFGAQGTQGAVGAQGAIGPAGLPGSNGINGVNGISGPPGQIGPTGPTGNQGVQGAQGTTGAGGLVLFNVFERQVDITVEAGYTPSTAPAIFILPDTVQQILPLTVTVASNAGYIIIAEIIIDCGQQIPEKWVGYDIRHNGVPVPFSARVVRIKGGTPADNINSFSVNAKVDFATTGLSLIHI